MTASFFPGPFPLQRLRAKQSIGKRMKITRGKRFRIFLRVAMRVVNRRQHLRSNIPRLTLSPFIGPEQFPDRQSAGVETDESGTLPEILPDSRIVARFASIRFPSRSISRSMSMLATFAACRFFDAVSAFR